MRWWFAQLRCVILALAVVVSCSILHVRWCTDESVWWSAASTIDKRARYVIFECRNNGFCQKLKTILCTVLLYPAWQSVVAGSNARAAKCSCYFHTPASLALFVTDGYSVEMLVVVVCVCRAALWLTYCGDVSSDCVFVGLHCCTWSCVDI